MDRIKKNLAVVAITLCGLICLWACGPAGDSKPNGTAEKKEHAHASEKHSLGEAKIEASVLSATQIGDLEAGAEGVFEVVVSGIKTSDLVVRLWIGTEDGKGSMRHKAGSMEAGHYHAHVQMPKPLSKDSKLWVELERSTDGSKIGKCSFTPKTEH